MVENSEIWMPFPCKSSENEIVELKYVFNKIANTDICFNILNSIFFAGKDT